MVRARRQTRASATDKPSPIKRLSWLTIVAGIITVPLITSLAGKDAFRQPKDAVLLAEAIALVAMAAIAALRFRVTGWRANRRHPVVLVCAGILVWSVVTTLTASHRTLAAASLVWVVSMTTIAVATLLLAPAKTLSAVYWPIIPGAVNAAIFLLQRFHVWSPFKFEEDILEHFRYTALIGNPDDVGSFFVPLFIVVITLASRASRFRLLWLVLSAAFALALLTGPLTSLFAAAAGAVTLAFVRSRRLGVIAFIALAVVIPTFIALYAPMKTRVHDIADAINKQDYATAFSGRVTPFIAAARMWKDHPISGVGLNCFRWQYFPYKLSVERARPRLIDAYAHRFNFAEVHNDHLQTLAETGLPGYALFLAVLFLIARCSRFPQRPDVPEAEFARLCALPLSVSLFILCLAHFPLHVAAPSAMFLYFAALCISWSFPPVLTVVPRSRSLPGGNTVRWVVAAIIISAAVYAFTVQSYRPYLCNIRKREVEIATMRVLNSEQYVAARQARQNLAVLQSCLTCLPADVDFYMLAAANDRILKLPGDAAQMYAQALQYDRRPELFFGLGMAQVEQGNSAAAIPNFVNAVLFNRDMLAEIPPLERQRVVDTLTREYSYFRLPAQ